MTIDTTKERVCINQLIGQKSETRCIEGEMIVPDIKPDILNVLQSTGNVCIYKKEILDGKVKIDGSVQVYIIYFADDENGSTRSLNTSLDFTEIIPMQECMQGMNAIIKSEICSIDTKVLNERKVNIKANVNFQVKLCLNENIELISGIEGINDLQRLNHETVVNSLVGDGTTKAIAKETIAIDPADNLAEILCSDIKITNKDTKISYNKVLVKADAVIRILYLTEDNRVNSCESTVAIMGFVDIQNVSDEHRCDTNYELKNLLIKPNSEEEHSIYVEAELEICCFAFERKNVTITEDLYSPTQNLDFTKKQVRLTGNKTEIKDVCSLKEKIEIPEFSGEKICYVTIYPKITSQNIENKRINFNGEVNLNLLFWNENENRINGSRRSIPLQFSMQMQDVGEESDIDTEIETVRQDFVVGSDGSIDARIDILFLVNSTDSRKTQVIDEITLDEESKRNNCSMVIYYAKPEDTLWKIAKRFGSTVEEIAKTNGIENPDILQVGRQLFIPRYCAKQTA